MMNNRGTKLWGNPKNVDYGSYKTKSEKSEHKLFHKNGSDFLPSKKTIAKAAAVVTAIGVGGAMIYKAVKKPAGHGKSKAKHHSKAKNAGRRKGGKRIAKAA